MVCDEQDSPPLPQPQAIVTDRTIQTAEGEDYQVLVEWAGLPREDATWESWDNLMNVYSAADLEDKVIFHGRGNDTHQEDKKIGPRLRGAPSWAVDYIS